MVDLTDLLAWQAPPEPPLPPSSEKTFHIFNDCWWTVSNGGCCLEWTVPTGTRNIKFELVGGGGPGGSSGGDHDGGIGGQGGAYAVKTLSTTAGGGGWVQPPDVIYTGGGGSSFAATVAVSQGKLTDFTITNGGTGYTSLPAVCFRGSTNHGNTPGGNSNSFQHGQSGRVTGTIDGGVITAMSMVPDFCSTAGNESVYLLCAGGTSCCSCCCSCNKNCKHGCTSYATGDGLQNFCAVGGEGGETNWDIFSNCYNCHTNSAQCSLGNYNAGWVSYQCGSDQFWGADYGFIGSPGGWFKAYDCCQYSFSYAGSPRGPFSSGGLDAMMNTYCSSGISCCGAHSSFPGGGGGGRSIGSSTGCVAQWGNSGLIKITYQ